MNNPNNEQHQTPLIKKPSHLGKIISFLTLLIALTTAAAIFFVWQQLQQHQLQSNETIAQLQRHLSHVNELLDQQAHASTATEEKFQAILDQQKQGSYVLKEVKYLATLAAFHLTFENNVVLARQLLETADQRISADTTSDLFPLRQAFAQDIAMLDATPTIDLAGLIARLQTLSQQAEALPQTPITLDKKEIVMEKTDATTAPISDQPTTWHAFLGKLKEFTYAVGHTLSTMVIVSKDSKSIPTLLTAEERSFVVTNLQSQLTLAQWAVVHRQADVYQQSLLQVNNWLQRYFSAESPLVQSMLKTTESLQKISVNPTVPNISRSLDALAKI